MSSIDYLNIDGKIVQFEIFEKDAFDFSHFVDLKSSIVSLFLPDRDFLLLPSVYRCRHRQLCARHRSSDRRPNYPRTTMDSRTCSDQNNRCPSTIKRMSTREGLASVRVTNRSFQTRFEPSGLNKRFRLKLFFQRVDLSDFQEDETNFHGDLKIRR